MNDPKMFEATFNMTWYLGYRTTTVRYWPVYGSMQIKIGDAKNFRWANQYDRENVLKAPNFQKLYTEYKNTE